ncbi:hypothetical protein B0H67DRAFT_558093 [Lasiosphaeris hirsuta]|uniref:Uncharacterized protein n=1 Tax=Lasiosphaeris hirsuta TaxID=260670 RepID=A0AA39ZXJ7_9PEZI|nr:hypothetical protein B0H67DRAFT_558093 [Lasiosphaeris hirsuta]
MSSDSDSNASPPRLSRRRMDPAERWKQYDCFNTIQVRLERLTVKQTEWQYREPGVRRWYEEMREHPLHHRLPPWPLYIFGRVDQLAPLADLGPNGIMGLLPIFRASLRAEAGEAGDRDALEATNAVFDHTCGTFGFPSPAPFPSWQALSDYVHTPANLAIVRAFAFWVSMSYVRYDGQPGTVLFLKRLERLFLGWMWSVGDQNEIMEPFFVGVHEDHRFLHCPAVLGALNLGEFARLQKVGGHQACMNWVGRRGVRLERRQVIWNILKEMGCKRLIEVAVRADYRVDNWFPYVLGPYDEALVPGEEESHAPSLSGILPPALSFLLPPSPGPSQPSPAPSRSPPFSHYDSEPPSSPAQSPSCQLVSEQLPYAETAETEANTQQQQQQQQQQADATAHDQEHEPQQGVANQTEECPDDTEPSIIVEGSTANNKTPPPSDSEATFNHEPSGAGKAISQEKKDKEAARKKRQKAARKKGQRESAATSAPEAVAAAAIGFLFAQNQPQSLMPESPKEQSPEPEDVEAVVEDEPQQDVKEKRKAKEQRRKERRRAVKAQEDEMKKKREEEKAERREQQRIREQEKRDTKITQAVEAARQRQMAAESQRQKPRQDVSGSGHAVSQDVDEPGKFNKAVPNVPSVHQASDEGSCAVDNLDEAEPETDHEAGPEAGSEAGEDSENESGEEEADEAEEEADNEEADNEDGADSKNGSDIEDDADQDDADGYGSNEYGSDDEDGADARSLAQVQDGDSDFEELQNKLDRAIAQLSRQSSSVFEEPQSQVETAMVELSRRSSSSHQSATSSHRLHFYRQLVENAYHLLEAEERRQGVEHRTMMLLYRSRGGELDSLIDHGDQVSETSEYQDRLGQFIAHQITEHGIWDPEAGYNHSIRGRGRSSSYPPGLRSKNTAARRR